MTPAELERIAEDQRRTNVEAIARGAAENPMHAPARIEAASGKVDRANETTAAREVPEPEPLRRPLPPADPYPIDALGPILSAAAQRIRDVVQAPAALCGQSMLAAVSLAAQPHADVVIDGRREPLSLFVMTIAESGERKSAADRVALQPHRDYERAALDRYRIDMQMHDIALQAHEAASRAVAKGKKAGAIRSALEDLGLPPAYSA